MKKVLSFVFILVMVLAFSGCGQQQEVEVEILIPAHSTVDFVFSTEEISPNGSEILISAAKGAGDTEVILKPIDGKEEHAYEPAYLTPGMPVKLTAEKGAWFQIGIAKQNHTDEAITVSVSVKNAAVRIA